VEVAVRTCELTIPLVNAVMEVEAHNANHLLHPFWALCTDLVWYDPFEKNYSSARAMLRFELPE
jgi:hypothetical protein